MAEGMDVAAPGDTDEDEFDLGEFDTKKGGKLGLILMILAGMGIGGGVGFTQLGGTVGPILAERALAAETDDHSEGGDDGHGEDDGHGGEGGEAAGGAAVDLHVVDNLVVNPARSQGTRFLLASIAIEVTDPASVAILEGRDVELRDALIMVLGAKTVDELTEITGRKALVDEISAAVTEVVGAGIVARVFIPQFVIQ